MTIGGKYSIFTHMKKKGRLEGCTAIVVVFCMVYAAICCGRTVCLCSDDPDGCGEPCHVCGEHAPEGLSANEACNHFSLENIDFWAEDATVALAEDTSAPDIDGAMRVLARSPISAPGLPAVCANAPPDKCSDSALFRVRKILLLS